MRGTYNVTFTDWVTSEYQRRGWSMRQLAQKMGYSHGTVSLVLGNKQPITWEFCAGVAKAFQLSAIEVFRRAELLPRAPDIADTIDALLPELDEEDQRVLLRITRALASRPQERTLRIVAEQDSEAYSVDQPEVLIVDRTSVQTIRRLTALPADRQAEIRALIDAAHEEEVDHTDADSD